MKTIVRGEGVEHLQMSIIWLYSSDGDQLSAWWWSGGASGGEPNDQMREHDCQAPMLRD